MHYSLHNTYYKPHQVHTIQNILKTSLHHTSPQAIQTTLMPHYTPLHHTSNDTLRLQTTLMPHQVSCRALISLTGSHVWPFHVWPFHTTNTTHNHPTFTKTNLLPRLQAQTLPDATPPVGKIHPFSKIAITFELIRKF